jgi:MFS family permease
VATFALLYSTQALLPELARAFSVSAAQSTLTLSLATAGLGLALLVTGPVSEILGRTRLIHLSLTASALVAAGCAVVPDWDMLLGLRLVQGITLAGLPAVATAYLREEIHPDAYARAAGLYVGGTALGGMAGRLITGAIAGAAGWRWALAAGRHRRAGAGLRGHRPAHPPGVAQFRARTCPGRPPDGDDPAGGVRPRAAGALCRRGLFDGGLRGHL